jgi:hypothetical protein
MQAIREAESSMNIKNGMLVFDVRKTSPLEQELGQWVELLDWALTNNMLVMHYINGDVRPSYVRMGGIIKTFTAQSQWLGFPTNELHWMPQSTKDEPPQPAENAAHYVHLTKAVDHRWVLDFIMTCETPWALVMLPKKQVEVILSE